jgi:hypothetical protein
MYVLFADKYDGCVLICRLWVPFFPVHTLRAVACSAPSLERGLTAHMSRKFVSTWMSLHFMHQLITRPAKIKKLSGTQAAEHGSHMIVNTEWGAFNNSVRTTFGRTNESP